MIFAKISDVFQGKNNSKVRETLGELIDQNLTKKGGRLKESIITMAMKLYINECIFKNIPEIRMM